MPRSTVEKSPVQEGAAKAPELRAGAPARPVQGVSNTAAVLIVGVLTVIGVALRAALVGQSLFADEMSTYWIISSNGLGGVISTVHTDAEITPPLYFVASWLTTRIDLTPELLRAPSMIAGAAAIPLAYLLGARTVGRRVGLLAAGLTALSPFMMFYSSEARGYEIAIVLVMASTLSLLQGIDDRRVRWWVAYAVCTCAAVYTHYTAVFALGVQLVWVLVVHPRARKPALLATAGAVVGYLPWFSGARNDFNSPTTDIVNSLNKVTLDQAKTHLAHWAIGHPYLVPHATLRALPGTAGLILLGLAIATAVGGLGYRWSRTADRPSLRLDDRLVLIAALAVSVPAGEALFSVFGTNTFGARYFAVSWPYLGLLLAALLLAAGPRLGLVAAALGLASFAFGAAKLPEARFARPDYRGAVDFIQRSGNPGDVVIDAAGTSPAPPTEIDAAIAGKPYRVFHVGRFRVQYNPFKLIGGPPPPADVTRRAVAAARGGSVFLVAGEPLARLGKPPLGGPLPQQVIAALPRGYRRVATRNFPGILNLSVAVYSPAASPRG